MCSFWKAYLCALKITCRGWEQISRGRAIKHPTGETNAYMMSLFSNQKSKFVLKTINWIKSVQTLLSAITTLLLWRSVLEQDADYPQAPGMLTLRCDLLVEYVYHKYQTCEHLQKKIEPVNTGWFFIHPGEICRACVLFLSNTLPHALSITLLYLYMGCGSVNT